MAQQFWTDGHGDIGVGYENEGSGFELHPHWHLHDNAVVGGSPLGVDGEFEANEIVAVLPASRAGIAPNNATFNTGTGAAAGSTIWTIPESNTAGVPWLGLGADELTNSDWVGGTVNFTLGAVTSPTGNGEFSLYTFDGLSTFTFYMSTADAGSNIGVSIVAGDHAHYNWAFTEAGNWSIDITVSGTHVTDGFQSTTETFNFTVVPEASNFGLLIGCAAAAYVFQRRRRA
ncbi:choice-of-anchor M domain-containing protein [Coraliomargarita akajimensis]|nr:choice-of-anchor M domain-containing protein [Coraliomargarita akajimensis]